MTGPGSPSRPIDEPRALRLLGRPCCRPLLDGARGAPPADLDSVVAAVVAISSVAVELGEERAVMDIDPLSCSPSGATALDALVIARIRAEHVRAS
ncbi:MAG: acetate--CoA ligase family protein [Acidimicrobiales bacterium]